MSETVFYIFEIIGIIAFSASGTMLAIDRNLDLFGVLLLGITTAFGGGIIRDIILGITPPKMFYSTSYILTAFGVSLLIFIIAAILGEKYFLKRKLIDNIFCIFDAIGLGIFSVIGVSSCITYGYGNNLFLCIFTGMTTGVGGGILRDVLSHSKPIVLHKQIYAVASIIGSAVYFYLVKLPIKSTLSVLISVLVVVAIRIISAVFRLDLPKVEKHQ